MNLTGELERIQSTKLGVENASMFIEDIPDIIFETEKKLEEATERRDMKRLFTETMEAGYARTAKEKNPKATRSDIEAIVAEVGHEERRDLIEHDAVCRKWEISRNYLKSKLWSAKSLHKSGR